MDTARLRKRFKYPMDDDDVDDDDAEYTPDDLDEEEQEQLISKLQIQDTANNEIYVKAFTVLPLVSIPAFVFYLFSSKARGGVRLLCLLAMTSLAATGFMMWFVPYSTQPHGKTKGGDGLRGSLPASKVRRVPFSDLEIDEDGPLGQVLPYLNLSICAILVFASWGLRGREDLPEGFWAFLLLPAVILGVVMLVRQSMQDVEKGIGELNGLRYGYKGA